MNYQWHYDQLILTRKDRLVDDASYYESHHILPKSLGGTNDNSNLIKLTPREHFLAHWLLWKIYSNRQMSYAFFSMCQFRKGDRKNLKFSSIGYAEARLSRAKTKVSDETKLKMSNASKGYKHTENTKIKMSKAKIGLLPWNAGKKGIIVEYSKSLSVSAQNRSRKHIVEFTTILNEYSHILLEQHLTILKMIVDGKTNTTICDILNIKDYYIKNVLRAIQTKYRNLA